MNQLQVGIVAGEKKSDVGRLTMSETEIAIDRNRIKIKQFREKVARAYTVRVVQDAVTRIMCGFGIEPIRFRSI